LKLNYTVVNIGQVVHPISYEAGLVRKYLRSLTAAHVNTSNPNFKLSTCKLGFWYADVSGL